MSHIPSHRYNFRVPGPARKEEGPIRAPVKRPVRMPTPKEPVPPPVSGTSQKTDLECKKIFSSGVKKNECVPGEKFTQTFTCTNTGTSDWPAGIQLKYISSFSTARMECEPTDPALMTLTNPVIKPKESYDLTLELTAPQEKGFHKEVWQLADPHTGKAFSKIITVQIDVD